MTLLQPDVSINRKFPNSEFHHLHINGQHHLGLYIPKGIHRGNPHNSWKTNDDKLKQVNKDALLWLCNQSMIYGDKFSPFDKNKVMKKVPQKIGKPSKCGIKIFIKARYVEDLGLKGGELYCMTREGRKLIIDFDCKEDEKKENKEQ